MAQKLRGVLSVRSRERALRRILFCALGLDCVLDLCVVVLNCFCFGVVLWIIL